MPTDEMAQSRWPDRVFYWSVLFTLIPEWANKYCEAVNSQRNTEKPVDIKETKTITVAGKWNKLDRHDFKSSRQVKSLHLTITIALRRRLTQF